MNEAAIKKMANKTWISAIIFVAISSCNYLLLSVYIIPYSERTGVPLTQIAFLFTFIGIGTAVMSLFLGKTLKHIRVKPVIIINSLLLASLNFALAFGDGIVSLYVAATLFGIALVFTNFGLANLLIISWFKPSQVGRRVTAVTSGLAVLTFIASPLVAKSVIDFGMTATATVHGIINIVVISLAAIFLVHERPSYYGITISEPSSDQEESKNKTGAFIPTKLILITVPFWLLILASIIESGAFIGYAGNASPLFQSFGLTAVEAALCISIVSGGQAITAPLFGWVLDKWGMTKAVAVFGGIVVIGFLSARFVNGFGSAIIFASLISFFAFMSFIAPVGFSKLYPDADLATLIGYATAAGTGGTMIGAPIGAWVYALTGSYVNFLTILAGAFVVCIILVAISLSKKSQAGVNRKIDSCRGESISGELSVTK